MTEDLDTLLARPLDAMPDNGFSNRVAALVETERLRRARLRTDVYIGFILLLLLVLPFTPLGAAFAAAALTRAGMALAGGAAVLLFLLLQRDAPFRRFTGSLA